jgi:hypothetical protein
MLDFIHAFLVERVNQKRDRLEEREQRGTDRECKRDAQKRMQGLRRRAFDITELRQEQRDKKAPDENAGFDGEQGG